MRQKFKNTIFHNHFAAILGQPAKEFENTQFNPPSEETINELSEAESVLSTIKQFDKLDKFSLEKKNLFHSYLEYWLGVIDKLKPDVFIFSAWPHTGYNFIIYCIAHYLKIKVILFEYARVGDRLLLINDWKIGSLALKEEIKRNQDKKYGLDDLSPDIKDYYKLQIDPVPYQLPPDLVILESRVTGFNLFKRKLGMIVGSIKNLTIFAQTYNYFLKQFKSNLKKEYEEWQSQPDFKKKYIYIALHYQPECSTSPLGGAYVDQALMVKTLSAAVPDDVRIYVKEHPYQWMPTGLSYSRYRYEGYYKSIAKLRNVSLMPIKTNTVTLIEKSQAVATVTGTAGFEAVLKQIPVLVFGHTYYRDCPGVFKISSVQSAKEAIDKIISGFKVGRQEIINYLVSLDRVSFHGYLEPVIEVQSKLTPEENRNNFVKAIESELKKMAKKY